MLHSSSMGPLRTKRLKTLVGASLMFSFLTQSAVSAMPDPAKTGSDSVTLQSSDSLNLRNSLRLKYDPLVSMNLNKANVQSIIEQLAAKARLSLMIDTANANDTVPQIDFRNLPLSEALTFVLKMKNLVAKRINDTLFITDAESLKTKGLDEPAIRSYRINNAKASEINSLLGSILTERGAKVKIFEDPRMNTLIVMGEPENIAMLDRLIPSLDKAPEQVMVELKFVEISVADSQQLGLSYSYGQGKFGAAQGSTGVGALGPGNPSAAEGTGMIIFNSLGSFSANFNARLQALISTSKAKVLSNPRIAAMDNQPATFSSTENIPVLTTTTTATSSTQSVTSVGIGEQITLTPRVDKAAGYVTIQITPTISARGRDVIVNGNPVPEVRQRTLTTSMRVKSGESIVLGGLKRRNDNDGETRLPLLGDIPFIGNLFKTRSGSSGETELLIMVTPYIITEGGNNTSAMTGGN